jgi:hypothetical protein
LDLIKISSELFAFNEVKLNCTTTGDIRAESAFLFTQLTELRIILTQASETTLLIKKTIDDFQQFSQLKFIALEFPESFCLDLRLIDRETVAQINCMSLNSIEVCNKRSYDYNDSYPSILLSGNDENGHCEPGTTVWTALTHLTLENCEIDIDMQGLADFFPRLENLHIFEDFDVRKPLVISKTDSFCALKNMRVLKLEHVAVNSFKTIDGMPNLEELNVKFANDLDSFTRIDSFPNFPKLTQLELRLKGAKWIHPKAFDHLTQLMKFEIYCDGLEGESFETGVAARSMSFHVTCKVVKLSSISVSNVEEIEIFNDSNTTITKLETRVALSGLKRLTMSLANDDLPFHQMTNLEYLNLKTSDLSITRSGHLKCLSKLRVLKVKKVTKGFFRPPSDPSNFFLLYEHLLEKLR